MAINLTILAVRLGVTGEPGFPARLAARLDRLWADVPGAVNITDGHPRFADHVVLLTAACDEWADLDTQMDQAGPDPARMNALTRESIRRIKEQIESM